ncbi:UNVERIFIED_CONTAM: hypothetical protein HDU68_004756 [Siphonaria sp. JEL0065]|nr:hypothetical protein HDU68_004756 [Siphonaria sp. JEL0065]
MQRSKSITRIPFHYENTTIKRTDSAISDLYETDSFLNAPSYAGPETDFLRPSSDSPLSSTNSRMSTDSYDQPPVLRRTRSSLKSTISLENFTSFQDCTTTSGYLFKLSADSPGSQKQLWIKRFFVLTPDTRLHVFQSATEKYAAPLATLAITSCSTPSYDKLETSHVLHLTGTSVATNTKVSWTLQCFDEAEMKHWAESIHKLFFPSADEPRRSTDSTRYMPRVLMARSSSSSLLGNSTPRNEERQAEMKAMHEEYLKMQKQSLEKFRQLQAAQL